MVGIGVLECDFDRWKEGKIVYVYEAADF